MQSRIHSGLLKPSTNPRSIILISLLVFRFAFAGNSGIDKNSTNKVSSTSREATQRSVTPLVFVSRNPVKNVAQSDPGAIPGIGPQYRTAKVGGKLIVRRRDGTLRTIVDNTRLFDVSDPSVSWDGATIIFAGVQHPDSSWRIYRVNADGSGFTQLTFSNRSLDLSQFGAAAERFENYDDFDPCYLPDGRIVFASTRHPSVASIDHVLTSNLFVRNDDGTLHRITTERNGAEEPAVDPRTGRVVYARWFVNLDRPSNVTRHGIARAEYQCLTQDIANVWQAITIKPDGEGLKMYAGFPRSRFGMQTYKPVVLHDGRMISTFTPHTSMTPTIAGTGLRWFKEGANFEHYIIGVHSDELHPTDSLVAPPFATDPVEYSNERILFSYSRDGKDYGLYTCNLNGSQLRKVIDLLGTLELDAQLLTARKRPPILEDGFPPPAFDLPPTEDPETIARNDVFRFDCLNIFINGAVDEPMADAPRITRNAKIRFFTNFQRQNPRDPDPSIFLRDADVFPAGGVHQPDIPADVPLFEQIVDSAGRVLETTDGKFAHVPGFNFERLGGGTKCVGCHAGHSMLTVPVNGTVAEWLNVSPSANVTASSFLNDKEAHNFGPRRAVDRQARTGGDTVNWVSNEGIGAYIELNWDIPVDVKQIVLYNIKQNSRLGTSILVNNCEIILYYKSREVARIKSTGKVVQNGTPINLPPTTIDAARVVIKSFAGTFHFHRFSGLAEIETVARIHQE